MSSQYIQDFTQLPPLSHSTAPSTSYNNNTLWNQSTNSSYQLPQGNNYPAQYASSSRSFNANRDVAVGSATSSNEHNLRLQLKLKDNQIESLENEIRVLNESINSINSSEIAAVNASNRPETVPYSVNEIFLRLNKSRLEILDELNDTKLRLETLVTAFTLNPSNGVTENGRYDELEVSHKILIKLESLKKENEELLKSLSFGKLKNLEMDIKLIRGANEELKRENQELKERLSKYESTKQ